MSVRPAKDGWLINHHSHPVAPLQNPNPRHSRPDYAENLRRRKMEGAPAKPSTQVVKGPSRPTSTGRKARADDK